MNAMQEQINLFSNICNNEWFFATPIILLLNKKDLFAQKIKKIPITKCEAFAEYEGPSDSFDECSKFIRNIFEQSLDYQNKMLFCHFTCAIDKDLIEKVFHDLMNVIINASLARGGCIGDIEKRKIQINEIKEEKPIKTDESKLLVTLTHISRSVDEGMLEKEIKQRQIIQYHSDSD